MSNKATQQERDFAIVMQQLSAEAEKILPGDQSNSLAEVRDPTEPGQQPDAFFERLHGLENSVLNRLEQIAAQMEASRAAAFAEQFRRIDEQLASIRNTESVNQQLFDSLHAELLKYRDNFFARIAPKAVHPRPGLSIRPSQRIVRTALHCRPGKGKTQPRRSVAG
jgi:hypothetical protein